MLNRKNFKARHSQSLGKRYLPNIAEVMALTWRFNPLSSSAIGLRADSAPSSRFSNPTFSVSQLALSDLNHSLSCSMVVKAVFNSSLALEASACWDFTFSWRSAVWASFLFSSAYKGEIYHQNRLWSTKRITSYALCTWGLMPICSIVNIFFTSLKYNASIILNTWGLMYICSKLTHWFKTRFTSQS